MISKTMDWKRLLDDAGDDIKAWSVDHAEIDWPASLRQPDWHLITDGDGSYCLLEPWLAWFDTQRHLFPYAHVMIAPRNRGARGWEIARQMLDWIEVNLGPLVLYARADERRTQAFLRRLGFRYTQDNVFIYHFLSK